MAYSLYLQRPYLLNDNFLKKVDKLHLKEEYARISLLDWDSENPREEIDGLIIGGSFNFDASSSMRRTGSLQMFVPETELDYKRANNILSLNTKITVEVGIKNTLDEYIDFPILWFPLGYYILRGINISRSNSGLSLNLSFKDKMCLFNGECGGMLPASVTFSEKEEYNEETDSTEITHPTIYQIIREIANHWGGQQLGKILISDVDEDVKQVVKWGGSDPLYVRNYESSGGAQQIEVTLSKPSGSNYSTLTVGDDVAYEITPFTYPGDLIGDAGTPITSILDKIRDTLGNYEYFFDIDGNFRFQEIKNYLNTSYSSYKLTELNENDIQDTVFQVDTNKKYSNEAIIDRSRGTSVYDFTDASLIYSYSNNPNYENIKNDFIIWGMRKGITGEEYPIRYHLAIDDKPFVGNDYYGHFIKDNYDRDIFIPAQPNEVRDDNVHVITKDWRTQLYMEGAIAETAAIDSNDYYVELANEWPKLYNILEGKFKPELTAVGEYAGVGNMDYFLEFVGSNYLRSNYGVKVIGRRTKVLVDNTINCIIEPPIRDFIIVETQAQADACVARQQAYCKVDHAIYENLILGGKYNGANVAAKDLLYQYTSFNETITLNTVPIYHLEPNTKIKVIDPESGIAGEYMIRTINLTLGIAGSMNITANQALVKI